MSLTEQQILQNRDEFISLLNKIERPGANIPKLIKKLDDNNFFTAPASSKYHGAYVGGLVEHCLNVYANLVKLVNSKSDFFTYYGKQFPNEETLIIVALLHDLDKMNKYTQGTRNVKKYSSTGSKHDELGNFDWVTELCFQIDTSGKHIVYGNHEMNSEYMARQFVPLTVEESVAILHHMGGMSFDSSKEELGGIFSEYWLALFLHLADMISTYVDEHE